MTVPTESGVVWLAPPGPYVFETVVEATSRDGPLRRNLGVLVAYSVLGPGAPRHRGRFLRRSWWWPNNPAYVPPPGEAVDPASIEAGRPSRPGADTP